MRGFVCAQVQHVLGLDSTHKAEHMRSIVKRTRAMLRQCRLCSYCFAGQAPPLVKAQAHRMSCHAYSAFGAHSGLRPGPQASVPTSTKQPRTNMKQHTDHETHQKKRIQAAWWVLRDAERRYCEGAACNRVLMLNKRCMINELRRVRTNHGEGKAAKCCLCH